MSCNKPHKISFVGRAQLIFENWNLYLLEEGIVGRDVVRPSTEFMFGRFRRVGCREHVCSVCCVRFAGLGVASTGRTLRA